MEPTGRSQAPGAASGGAKLLPPHSIPPSSLITPWLQSPLPTHAAFPPGLPAPAPPTTSAGAAGAPPPGRSCWELSLVPPGSGRPTAQVKAKSRLGCEAHHRLGRLTRPAVRVERTLLPLWPHQGQSLALHRSP